MSVRKSRGEKQIAGTLNNRRSEGTGTPNSNQPSSIDTQQMTLTAGFFFSTRANNYGICAPSLS